MVFAIRTMTAIMHDYREGRIIAVFCTYGCGQEIYNGGSGGLVTTCSIILHTRVHVYS